MHCMHCCLPISLSWDDVFEVEITVISFQSARSWMSESNSALISSFSELQDKAFVLLSSGSEPHLCSLSGCKQTTQVLHKLAPNTLLTLSIVVR